MVEKDQVWFVLNCNQSFQRLPVKTQYQLTNIIHRDYFEIEAVNGADFLTLFRSKAEPDLKRADFEKGNPFAIWKATHIRASFLATKEQGEKGDVNKMAESLALNWGASA